MKEWILISVILPAVMGVCLLLASFAENVKRSETVNRKNRRRDRQTGEQGTQFGLHCFVGIVLALSVASTFLTAYGGEKSLVLFPLVDGIPVAFRTDDLSCFFVTIVGIVWLCAGVYSFRYMSHEGDEKRFYGFYLLLYGVLCGLCFSANLVTMYLFYELMTLTSMPLVLHNGSREAIMASLKYLFYSMCGAYAGLFGIFFLNRYCDTLDFVAGGSLNMTTVSGQEDMLLVAVFVMLLGFGAKAGLFPMHAWLPAAHPVAPSPASAVLSGVIVKFGVFAMIRTVFYVVGPAFLRGTWVQYAWMTLALLTVFMGSMLAFGEPVLKKRLAYSTVSQISYILFGLSLLTPTAFSGALLHTAVHAFVKCGLFLTAGVWIWQSGLTRVEELRGIGRKMPVLLWGYTVLSLALVGIPPTGGFLSKWYLAQGAVQSQTGVFRLMGPAVLLVSALLTAGYLFPITMNGFFPGKTQDGSQPPQRKDPPAGMLVPVLLLALAAVLLGVIPGPVTKYIADIAALVCR